MAARSDGAFAELDSSRSARLTGSTAGIGYNITGVERILTGVYVDAKKLIAAVLVAFVIFYVVTSPDDAAKISHTVWHGVVNTAHGVSTYIDKL